MRAPINLDGLAIVVVEDEFYIAADTARALSDAGARIIGPFANEESAGAGLGGRIPDAAVLDINFGHGASFRLAERLQEAGVPIVFVTGYDPHALPAEFAGVACLMKPLDITHVVEAVARLFSQAPAAQALKVIRRCG